MKQSALDVFGEIFISRVRDHSINQWEMILDGRMKSDAAKNVRKKIKNLHDDSQEVFTDLLPEIIDTAIFSMLVMFESEEGIAVSINRKGVKADSINEISDGLAGELFSENGWIAKYSQKPHNEG